MGRRHHARLEQPGVDKLRHVVVEENHGLDVILDTVTTVSYDE